MKEKKIQWERSLQHVCIHLFINVFKLFSWNDYTEKYIFLYRYFEVNQFK